ncbi:MAG TPA: putative 2OG-Fe(II) oxygenase [Novosphingobium sp.]|nr:putative 2OG-Fe(II) oxygenase [Novosphingobium sp.]
MTLAEERALARQAYERAGSALWRLRGAQLATQDDDYAEVVTLLEQADDLEFSERLMLMRAYLAMETPADTERARLTAEAAVAVADLPLQRAAALADRAKAERRLSLARAARGSLEAALADDPHNKDACKRLAALDLEEGRAPQLVDWCKSLTGSGVGHARLHAAHVLGEAARGDLDAARAVEGFAALSESAILPPPPGWSDLAAFNAALAAELLGHRNMRYERYGSASNYTWRIDWLARPETPLVRVLLDHLAGHIQARVGRLDRADHRWLADKPERALLRAWCVITEGDGFEGWHVHQFGWLSGVYYVQIPEEIALGRDLGGCLGFGLPDDLSGQAVSDAYGTTVIRPEPGMMVTFPSHTFHRTFAHHGPGKRICIAFDVKPA